MLTMHGNYAIVIKIILNYTLIITLHYTQSVLNLVSWKFDQHIDCIREVPILMFLRIVFSTRLEKEKLKSGHFSKMFLIMVLNLSFLKIRWNIDFIRKVPILMLLRILFFTRLKKENVDSGNFQFLQFFQFFCILAYEKLGEI